MDIDYNPYVPGIKPPKFAGDPKEDVIDFIHAFKGYFILAAILQHLKVGLIAYMLSSDACKWYMAHYKNNALTLEVLFEKLEEQFSNEVCKNQLCDKLAKLHQRKSVNDYSSKFMDLVSQIGN
ncbi:hypothetical protein EC988_008084 [Linderina pennispora]|nr:hypothetical protein EC988_008084 [Linderina pennispora]